MTGLVLLLAIPFALLVGVFVRQAWLGVQDANRGERERMTCKECGERASEVAWYPTEVGFVNRPHYYCPNDHRVYVGPPRSVWGDDETASDRLGGWAP